MRSLIQLLSVLFQWSAGIKHSRVTIAFAIALGLIAGFGSTALVALINDALAGHWTDRQSLIRAFVALCVVVPVSGFASQALLIRLAAQAARDLRLRLARQILYAPYRLQEELGAHRLLATVTDDIPNVTTAITNLPLLIMQIGIIGGCLAYLGWLSWPLLVVILVYMGLGILSYQVPIRKSVGYFRLMREEWDRMFHAIRALTDGGKELKLNRERRRVFLADELEPPVEALRLYGVWGNTLSLAAGNWGQILFFVLIGLILFALPTTRLDVDSRAATGYTLTILFMITPLTLIMNTLPSFGRAHVAAEKVRALGLSLDNSAREHAAAAPARASWRRLDLVGVTHSYRFDGAVDEFSLGPLDLTFVPGELVFIIGGNGSGKTTLAKLLTGLYEPEQGEIRLDGTRIGLENRDDYRQYFSVVFADFFLFERLLGPDHGRLEATGRELLARLDLSHKVDIRDGKLSTLNLSHGQRKRLALLTAWLEDRPIYVFDEWASDQDPVFRQLFYRQFLPALRDNGKTVIVITHDDRYYDIADRLIKLDRGRLEHDGCVSVAASVGPLCGS